MLNWFRRPFSSKPVYEYVIPTKMAPKNVQRLSRLIHSKGGTIKKLDHENPFFQQVVGAWGKGWWRVKRLSPDDEYAVRQRFRELRMVPTIPKAKIPRGVEIKFGTIEDLGKIHEVETQCFSENTRASSEELEHRLKLGRVRIAVKKGRIVGFSYTRGNPMRVLEEEEIRPIERVRRVPAFEYHHQLVDIAVLPEHRKKGIGEALLAHEVNDATRAKYTKFYLKAVAQPSTSPFGFYERAGFVRHPTKAVEGIGDRIRVYMRPLAIGQLEREYKQRHGYINDAISALPHSRGPAREIEAIADGMEWKYEDKFRGMGNEQKAEEIAKVLAHELLERSTLKQLSDSEVFGLTARSLVGFTPAAARFVDREMRLTFDSFYTHVLNMVRRHYNLNFVR